MNFWWYNKQYGAFRDSFLSWKTPFGISVTYWVSVSKKSETPIVCYQKNETFFPDFCLLLHVMLWSSSKASDTSAGRWGCWISSNHGWQPCLSPGNRRSTFFWTFVYRHWHSVCTPLCEAIEWWFPLLLWHYNGEIFRQCRWGVKYCGGFYTVHCWPFARNGLIPNSGYCPFARWGRWWGEESSCRHRIRLLCYGCQWWGKMLWHSGNIAFPHIAWR